MTKRSCHRISIRVADLSNPVWGYIDFHCIFY